MSIIRRALGLEAETRLFQSTSLIPRPGEGYVGEAGSPVNVQTATSLTAVWAAVGLVADTIASLPSDVYLRRGAARIPLRPRPSWLDIPVPADPNFTTWNHWHQVALSLLLHGNSYTYVVRNRRGEVVEVRVLNPERVAPTMIRDPKTGEEIVAFQIRANEGKEVILGPNEIIHIKRWTNPGEIVGLSPIEACRTSLGGTIATEQFGARWFRNSGVPSGVIQVPGELTEEQAAEIVGGWRRRHSGSNTPGILTGGATFQPIQVKPADIAWLDARKFGIDEVSRIFRVPTTKLSGETASRSYNSIEADQTAFVVDSVRPWLELIERSYQRIVPGGADSFIKFNVDGLLRGDAKSRSEAYATGIRAGYMTVADVRRLEDLAPLGDELREPLREVNLAPAALSDLKARADIAGSLIQAGFDMAAAAEAAGLEIEVPENDAPPSAPMPPTGEQPAPEQTQEPLAPPQSIASPSMQKDADWEEGRHLAGQHNQKTHAKGFEYGPLPAGVTKGTSFAEYIGADGKFTPERAELHRQIVDTALSGYTRSENPTFYMTGGGPAAGKSRMLERPDSGIPGQDKAVQINPDEYKKMLPEYNARVSAGDKRAAAYVHEESSHIAKLVQAEAAARGIDVVLDGTGDSSAASVLAKTELFRKSGYTVKGSYVTVPTDVAVARALARGDKTGRYIPEAYLRSTHASVSRVVPEIATSAFDSFELFDSTNGLTKVAQAVRGGALEILDQNLWDQFLAKGRE